MPINTNLCENKFVPHQDKMIMLQAASIYTQGDGKNWDGEKMLEIMIDVAETSLMIMAKDLWNQINTHNGKTRKQQTASKSKKIKK